MPLVAGAVAAGKAAFSLIPKNKEQRKKAAEKFKKGFQWVKKQAGKLGTVKKTEAGYKITGKSLDIDAGLFGGKKTQEPMDWMKYAPYLIGGLVLLTMKK